MKVTTSGFDGSYSLSITAKNVDYTRWSYREGFEQELLLHRKKAFLQAWLYFRRGQPELNIQVVAHGSARFEVEVRLTLGWLSMGISVGKWR